MFGKNCQLSNLVVHLNFSGRVVVVHLNYLNL